ncbi:MAG: SDR family oxidoreductase [Bacteroidota bacterium]
MKHQEFHQQTAIITGAGIGIGFEIACQLARKGVSVVLNDVDETIAQQAADAITAEGGKCTAVVGDSSDMLCIEQMVGQAVQQYGRLDMAIANAGITTFGSFLEYQPDMLQRLMAVNLQGSFFLAQRAALQMIKQESGGSLLLMSSVTGHQAHPDLTAYGMTKAALRMLAKSLAVELASYGIRVNALSPGATLTERTVQLDPHFEDIWERITPLGKTATPADIAHAALFLLSPQAGHITGQTLVIDGGWTSVSPPPE